METRKRVFEMLEKAAGDDRASRVFDVSIMVLIGLNVIAVALETVEALASKYGPFFRAFEIVSVCIFTVEYILRLWSCTSAERYKSGGPIIGRLRMARSPMVIVDLVAILPFYLPMIIPLDLRFIRALRLFRLFRLFKMGRYSDSLRTLGNVVRREKEKLAVTVFIAFILLVIASSLIYFAEHDAQPKTFSSIPASMWWGVVTLTTVGYGDVCPVTAIGKGVGALVTLLGVAMVALPAGIIASGFQEEIKRKSADKDHVVCPHCGRLIPRRPEETR